MRKVLFGAAVALVVAGVAGLGRPVGAATEAEEPPAHSWSFEGPFGTFDRAAAQRGFQVYSQVCAACHSMHFVAYRDLQSLGFSEEAVKAIAAGVEVTDGPNDDGEMFERPGRPSDRFKSPFPNDKAARAANGGALPVDLSLIAKAREGGPDYLYGILTGFQEPPAGFNLAPGMHYNLYFPGHQIAMPPPLSEGAVEYTDGTRASIEQMAHDVVTFMMWAAEPKLEDRKRLGFKAMAYLLVLCGILFAVKRKVWAAAH